METCWEGCSVRVTYAENAFARIEASRTSRSCPTGRRSKAIIPSVLPLNSSALIWSVIHSFLERRGGGLPRGVKGNRAQDSLVHLLVALGVGRKLGCKATTCLALFSPELDGLISHTSQISFRLYLPLEPPSFLDANQDLCNLVTPVRRGSFAATRPTSAFMPA
jgi:hypothetical protein